MMASAASSAAPAPESRAFRALQRALTRRRLRALDPRLGLEVAVIAVLLAAVLFWQVRVPLDGWAHHHGPWAAAGVAAALFAVVAALGLALTMLRLRGAIAGSADGPDWLALPCHPAPLRRHLEWNARAPLPFFLLAQLAIWIALVGLVPPWAMFALGAGALALTILAAHAGAALGMRIEARPGGADHEWIALATALARSHREVTRARRAAPSWATRSPLLAILAHDWTLLWRTPPARARALLAAALALGGALVWSAPWHPALCRAAAFGLALLAAAVAAEALIDSTSLHPCGVLRTLPIGVGAFWGARLVAAFAIAALITALQVSAAGVMGPEALRVHLVWTGVAALVILTLGANIAVTLYPRGDHARRVLSLSLALAATASFILPLAGWVLMLTFLLHSVRRLPPWTRGELLTCS
jgi:hypothetical protein